MIKKGWLLIVLLVFAMSSSGCDKIKGMIKKGKNYVAEKDSKNDAKDSRKKDGNRSADRPSRKDRDRLQPSEDQASDALDGDDISAYRNEPINYGQVRSGQYALVLKRFRDKYDSEDYSRKLRRQRINNYITFDEDSKKYLVLTGSFVTRSQAEKQARYLEKNGYDTEVYAGN